MQFQSNAEEIKYYMKKLLDGGKEKTTKDIINYVKEMSNKEFTSGMISGAINDLVYKENAYKRIGRGVYQKNPISNNQDKFDEVIKNAITGIEQAMIIDIRELTPETLQSKKERAGKIISMLNTLLN